jgi:mono/diheme cytochrome c family protein
MKRLVTSIFALACLTGGTASAKEPPVSFADDVQPILQIRCQACHQPGGDGFEKSGFDVTTYKGVMAGTKFGPMIVAGDPNTSSLMVLLDGKAKGIQMPHGKRKLSTCDRDMIRTWIREGAKNN